MVRGTKREAIRVDPDLWREYGLACRPAHCPVSRMTCSRVTRFERVPPAQYPR